MEYRKNQRTGDHFSVIGIGTAEIGNSDHDTAITALKKAYDNGVRVVDLAAGNRKAIEFVGEAFKDVRPEMIYQVHFGADYTTGEYGWTTSLNRIKAQVVDMLDLLHTDYIDYGFIHCLDEDKDLDHYIKQGVLDYLLEKKKDGTVHHLGLSSHTPKLVNRVLDMNLVDQVMFSINPAYDFEMGDYSNGKPKERQELYRHMENEGVGITVMKPLSGGLLIDKNRTPLAKPLSIGQCLDYALNQPGVLTAVCGMASPENVDELLAYFDLSEEEKRLPDGLYASSSSKDPHCVYCSHCHPCSVGLNIALINKYYDLAKAGDSLAADHYRKLEKHASDCIHCGHCSSRCPFHTDPMNRMADIVEYFSF